MSKAKTPDDLTIRPRDMRFGRGTQYRRWWLNDDPFATAFYNAMSVTFPKGEGFFIDSLRAYRAAVPDRLAAEIAAFVRQEAIHTREHMAFNRHVEEQGYDTSRLEARVDRELAITKGRAPILNLAATMALEHFTAILAHELLAEPRHLYGGDTEAADLWRWHAIEEIEHKGVAYDTWSAMTRDWSRWKRWRVKTLVMLIVSGKFLRGRTQGALDLLEQDGIVGWRARFGLARYALGRTGMARRAFVPWLAYFLPGFHPWNEDDRALINAVDSEFTAARPAAA